MALESVFFPKKIYATRLETEIGCADAEFSVHINVELPDYMYLSDETRTYTLN